MEQRVLCTRTPKPLLTHRAQGVWGPQGCGEAPWRVYAVLGHQFPDLMRSHKREHREPGPLFWGTVYLVNCIFMIKFTTLRGQEAKDMGLVCEKKLIPAF